MTVFRYTFLVVLTVPFFSRAQNQMTSSPYSMFGIGEFQTGLYGANSAMGGVSYGIRDNNFINMENPAGLVSLDSNRLYAETSAFGRFDYTTSGSNSNTNFSGNLGSFTLAGRMYKWWYASAGISPYTSVGYYFNSTEPVEGTVNTVTNTLYQGSGGLSRASLGNAIRLPYGFSVGVRVDYMFGKLFYQETQLSLAAEQEMYTQQFHLDAGIQYQRQVGKESYITMGAVYGYKQSLTMTNSITVTGTSTSAVYTKQKVRQYIPAYYGMGGSYTHKKSVFALDYTLYEYSVLNSSAASVQFRDVYEARLGYSFLPGRRDYGKYRDQINYKLGAVVGNSIYHLNGKDGYHFRVSAGVGLPLSNGLLNTAIYYDQERIPGKLQMHFIGLNLTFTLSERLFRIKL